MLCFFVESTYIEFTVLIELRHIPVEETCGDFDIYFV